jgi:hypothetical protein
MRCDVAESLNRDDRAVPAVLAQDPFWNTPISINESMSGLNENVSGIDLRRMDLIAPPHS